MVTRTLAIIAFVLLLRLPFLHQAIQGDDVYYLAGAEHAQIDPLHPNHARYLFQGDLVDMRGHPHPPLNSWVLAALVAATGGVREAPFHLAYTLFSLIAALSMWSLARRFCENPFLATLLFLAVPAFVVNGNSLESDLPFLAFWMAAIALFVRAVDRPSGRTLACAAAASVLAAMAAYQAIFLTPVLAAYLWERRSRWRTAWCVVLVAPAALGAWQLFERSTSGTLPATVLAGYMQTYGWQAMGQKARNAAALVAHSGWIVSPVLVLLAFGRAKWECIAAAIAALAAAFYDPNPMFWASIGCGVLVLASCVGRGFLGAWVLIFFAGALVVFFAGSARYLLPVAAPVAILVARSVSPGTALAGFGLQMAISLGLAVVNYQHWDGYRQFAASIANRIGQGHSRTWINGEWGLRYYLESEGALPLAKGQALAPGDILVTSALAYPLPVNAALAPLAQLEIRPSLPLRLVSLDGRSAYSAAAKGLWPFEFSTAVIDVVRAEIAIDRKPQLTWIDPHDPKAAPQIIGGLFADGWMADQATVLLKRPEQPLPLRAAFFIPPQAPARRVRLLVDGQAAAEETFTAPGVHALAAAIAKGTADVTVTLAVDRTFSAPPDRRTLGMIVTGIGFRE